MDKVNIEQRLFTMIPLIKEKSVNVLIPVDNFGFMLSDYKTGSEMPVFTKDNSVPFGREDFWGGKVDTHAWFYKKIAIPERKIGLRYELSIKTNISEKEWDASNPQFIVYFDGYPVQGADLNHTNIVLPDKREVEVYVYAYTGTNLNDPAPVKFYADIVGIDETAERLYYDLKVPYDVIGFTDANTKEYVDILRYLNNTLNLIDWLSDDKMRASFAKAADYIEKEFYGTYCKKGNVKVKCVGHTHIDIGWLWTVKQTREKAQRSFFTVLELMKRYPEYKFMSSQAPLYLAVKEEAPEKYEEIKERVKEGRWEVEGAMWVEADCNLTSGESLVRQVLYGKRFFKNEFGVDSKTLWLPDVFGYSAALPQILKKCGVDSFVTSKISWNDTNMMPNDTFTWKGIDGSEIFTHFMTAQEMPKNGEIKNFTTYLPQGNASYVMGAWRRNHNKDIVDDALLTFGFGDGGGGPTSKDIEMLKRMEYGIPGCPTTEFSDSTEFLNEIKEQSEGQLEKWVGELYFEYHRGTYTSQSEMKKNNRKCEFALQNTELFSVIADSLSDVDYPKEKLDKMWKTVLVNQFHDILPGSAIKEVYETANAEEKQVREECEKLLENAFKSVADNIEKAGTVVFNPTSFNCGGTVVAGGKTRYCENIPAKGYAVTDFVPFDGSVKVTDKTIENKYFIVEFDDCMEISGIYDKRNSREVIPQGKTANRIVAFEDYPNNFDAWEIREYYKEKSYPINDFISCEKVFDGERSGLKIVRKFEKSTIEQTILLYEHIDRIDFDTKLDWQTEHVLVKAFFPVDVNAEKATFDTQFGNLERPAHANTSWDKAKFEVCGHKFADLSDDSFGLSVLNDCKYGYSVRDGEIGLSLLRCPTYPDPDCDKGEHTFTYSLYPHAGAVRNSEVYKQAYLLNNPFIAATASGKGKLPEKYSFASADKSNVIIDTIKRAEDSDDIIVRLFESENKTADVNIKFALNCKKVSLCDLTENELKTLPEKDGVVSLRVKPFEIITLKIYK